MYDNEYEWDILLFLRILKYLHTSDADMVNAIIRDYHACRSQNRTEEEKERLFYKALAGKALQTIPWKEKSKDNENT